MGDAILKSEVNTSNTSQNIQRTLPFSTIFTYGTGNFASQLSWTMVSTYLIIFYTDVFGLATGAVALLMLVAKVWDGINDPIMGMIMERTHTRWGRFRPYIMLGSPLLVIFTVLTFTVPEFGDTGKLVYAYITYIGLGMAYTVVNVPYVALPGVMTNNSKDINRLNAAQMLGMTIGMIILNLSTLPLVKYLGGGVEANGYRITATIYAFVSLPIFLLVFLKSKEVVQVKKGDQPAIRDTIKYIVINKNLMMTLLYILVSMSGLFGRLGIAVFYYIHVVKRFDLITIFMISQLVVGTLVMPFAPKVIDKLGKRNTAILAMCLQMLGMAMIFFGDYTNIPYLLFSHFVYGLGYVAGPCGNGMIVDAVTEGELKWGIRADGTAFSLAGLGTKVAGAIGSALGIWMIGLFGYTGGHEVTAQAANGINISANLMPMICFGLSIVPLLFYNLTDKRMDEIRLQLAQKR